MSSGEIKRLAGNFVWLLGLQMASYIFPLITMPYLAKTIGLVGFGKIAFASAIITWIQTIADWGFNFTATRDVAKNRNNHDTVSRIFSNVLWARIVLMLFSLLILLILIFSIEKFRDSASIILVTFLLIPGHIFCPDWFFQAMERMRYITIFNVLSKLLFTIAVFTFIKEEEDYILQPFFVSLGFALSGLIAIYIIIYKWNVKIYPPAWKSVFSTIKQSTDVFLNNLMPNLYNSFSIILLGVYGGNVANGKLDAGTKFVSIGQQFLLVMSRCFFPFLSRKISYHTYFTRLNIVISIIFSIGLFVCAPILIHSFFSFDFNDSIKVLRILSISIVFLMLSNVYGTNYLIIQGYERELRNITFVSSCIGFIISFPLIYFFSYIGAAITISTTRGILGLSIMCFSLRIKSKTVNKQWKNSQVE